MDSKLDRKHQGDLLNKNSSNRSIWKFKMAEIVAILKIYFLVSFSELKGQLTRNLVKCIRMSCRSKIAKIVLIGNGNGGHLENLFFATSTESKAN